MKIIRLNIKIKEIVETQVIFKEDLLSETIANSLKNRTSVRAKYPLRYSTDARNDRLGLVTSQMAGVTSCPH